MARDVNQIDAEALGREAVDKAVRSRGAVRFEPGEYPVVLESYAVGEMLLYLAYMGFGALSLQEGTSFLRGKIGQPIVDRRISIKDDARDPVGLLSAFDFEGVPRQPVDLIRDGKGAGVVYDTRTAIREGHTSTGHALPAPSTFGPFPSHLIIAAGDTPQAELAKGIDRGLWVTRFNYVNVVKSDRAVLTGLTKDGTYLIENGEVTRPVKNLRFTESVLDTWSGLRALGAERKLLEGWGGAVVAPSMTLDRFRFTGVSDV
jgi:predicted Zn-dependent protease